MFVISIFVGSFHVVELNSSQNVMMKLVRSESEKWQESRFSLIICPKLLSKAWTAIYNLSIDHNFARCPKLLSDWNANNCPNSCLLSINSDHCQKLLVAVHNWPRNQNPILTLTPRKISKISHQSPLQSYFSALKLFWSKGNLDPMPKARASHNYSAHKNEMWQCKMYESLSRFRIKECNCEFQAVSYKSKSLLWGEMSSLQFDVNDIIADQITHANLQTIQTAQLKSGRNYVNNLFNVFRTLWDPSRLYVGEGNGHVMSSSPSWIYRISLSRHTIVTFLSSWFTSKGRTSDLCIRSIF